jgi:hypothetical protein
MRKSWERESCKVSFNLVHAGQCARGWPIVALKILEASTKDGNAAVALE